MLCNSHVQSYGDIEYRFPIVHVGKKHSSTNPFLESPQAVPTLLTKLCNSLIGKKSGIGTIKILFCALWVTCWAMEETLGCWLFGMPIVKHPILYCAPQRGGGPAGPPPSPPPRAWGWGCDTLVGPLGCYVGASVSCHTWWSLVWSRSECNSNKNVVVGMYNTVFMVKSIVDISIWYWNITFPIYVAWKRWTSELDAPPANFRLDAVGRSRQGRLLRCGGPSQVEESHAEAAAIASEPSRRHSRTASGQTDYRIQDTRMAIAPYGDRRCSSHLSHHFRSMYEET